jgi:prepilin-type N-terminal cleavage/methylation domain-containing protein
VIGRDGFTLLEVLVALVILTLGGVALVQLSAQGLRLVKQSGDHQSALELADRLARETGALTEGVQTGRDGPLSWERRIELVPTPEALRPPAGPSPRLVALTITVRWSPTASLTLATLRTGPAR